MDGATVPPSSDFTRFVEDWGSPTVASHADELKQAGHTILNGSQAQPRAHPVMGSTDLRLRPKWADTKGGRNDWGNES